MDSNIDKIEGDIASLMPDAGVRRLYLSMFLESLVEAHSHGANKWGVQYLAGADRLRLLVGSIIVLTVHKRGVWIALDQELLHESKEEQDLLNFSKDWNWDADDYPKYKRVPSKNGYYTLLSSGDYLQVWPIIRRFHFAFVKKVAKMFFQLREDSQRRHMPEVLAYLRQELGQYVPEPIYDNSVLSTSNPIQEIREFQSTPQYLNLSETERESIIQSRIGQGQFRAALIRYFGGCAVTDCQMLAILRASHIKPWRKSSNPERLDVYNGLLLVPNLDVAFDNGLITFADDGKIIISDSLAEGDRLKLGIYPDMKIARMSEKHLEYLKYHRENEFEERVH